MKKLKRSISAALAAMLVLTSVCMPAGSAAAVKEIAIKQALYAVQIGACVQIEAISEEALTFTSSDPDTVSVSQTGRASGKKMGRAVITVSSESGSKATCTVSSGYYTGIDVSSYNGDYENGQYQPVNWKKVKNYGVNFAMIRAGYGWEDFPEQNDKQFVYNVQGAAQYGIPFGLYFYSYAETTQDAEKEADYLLREIKECIPSYKDSLSLPIAYDIEEPQFYSLDSKTVTDIVLAFCNKLQAEGFKPMVYSNTAISKNLDFSRLRENGVGIWYTFWPNTPDFSAHETVGNTGIIPDIWQYTSNGSIPGAFTGSGGNTDLNILYMLSSFQETHKAPAVTGVMQTGSGSVELTWEKAAYAQSYAVSRAPVTAAGDIDVENAIKLAELSKDTHFYTDETALAGSTYCYYVSAILYDFLDPAYTQTFTDVTLGKQVHLDGKIIMGDVNGDGVVNIQDVLMLQKALAKTFALTPAQAERANVTGGTLSVDDVLLIQKYIAHMLEEL